MKATKASLIIAYVEACLEGLNDEKVRNNQKRGRRKGLRDLALNIPKGGIKKLKTEGKFSLLSGLLSNQVSATKFHEINRDSLRKAYKFK